MTKLRNVRQLTSIRQKLRNESPKAERIVWKRIRHSQLAGHKFRRQFGFGRYVVDFYCPQLKMAIEIDGGYHFSNKKIIRQDQIRQSYIESLGVRFLRFTNAEIYNNLDGVLNAIAKTATQIAADNYHPGSPEANHPSLERRGRD